MQFVVQNFEQINVMYSTFSSKRKEVNPTSAYNNDDHPVIEPWRSDSKETQKDVRNLVASPFTAQIRDYDMPDGLKVPTNLKTYDGMSDPDDHLTVFMGTIDVYKLPEPAWCRFFHIPEWSCPVLDLFTQAHNFIRADEANTGNRLRGGKRGYLYSFFDILPYLSPFGDVFGLPDGGAIGGNVMGNELLSKPSWTTAYKNNKVQVKAEQSFEAIAGVEPSYTGYPNDVPQLNPTQLPFNESSSGSSAYYQMRVEELTSSLYQTEGMLTTAQAMNGSIQTTMNSLCSENESLKSYHTMSCVGYINLFGDLPRANELEVNLSKKVTLLERYKVGLKRDLEWVMRKAIPRMLAKVLRSEQFDNEMLKVQKVLIDRGRDLGRQEARGLLMSNQRLLAFDPDLPRKAKDVVKAPRMKGRVVGMLSKDLSSKLSDLGLRTALQCLRNHCTIHGRVVYDYSSKGRKNGSMILDSIDEGPLFYPTVVGEDGQTRPKKYFELTEEQQLQDDCDVQATNIILHSLPPDVYLLGETLYVYYWMTKPQVFYDDTHKQALGYQNSFHLKKAQRIKPTLYDGNVIAKKHDVISVIDDEETLILEEDSRSKMLNKQNDPMSIKQKINISPIDYSKLNKISEDFGKRFVTKKELSAEQAFWLKHSNYIFDTSVKSHTPIRIETPSELPKVVKNRTTPDAITEGAWGFKHTKACFVTEIIPFLKVLKDKFNAFDKTLLDEITEVQTVFNQMEVAVDQFSVDKNTLEIQIKQLRIDNDQLLNQIMSQEIMHIVVNSIDILDVSKSCVDECNKCLEFENELLKKNDLIEKHSVENLNLNAQLQEKVFAVAALKNELRKLKGKTVVDTAVSTPIATTIAPGMFKLDIEPIFHRLNNNRDAHEDYLKKTIENTDTIRGLVERARKQNPSEPLLDSACMFTKHISKPVTSSSNIPKKTDSLRTKDSNKPLLTSTGVNTTTSASGSKPSGNTKKNRISRPPSSNQKNKVEEHPRKVKSSLNKTNSISEPISLVRGLPKLNYKKDHLCSACALSKSKKHSHKPKDEDSIQEKLYLLHMDLCGPMRIQSINGRKYILVIIDDYSRFTWVKFLRSKDEVPEFVIKFLKMIQVHLNAIIQAVAIACYTQNRSLIQKRYNKTPYELLKDRKPDLSYLHVFFALCYPTNDCKDLGKLKPKADIGIFVGYAPAKKAFKIYNKRTRLIIETIHVDFDELTTMAFEQFSSGPGPQLLTPGRISSGLVQNIPSPTSYVPGIGYSTKGQIQWQNG
ncbi:retrovirus-related pol polyprotein from transposon TNT 1-94 [Tanacetum coccineum]